MFKNLKILSEKYKEQKTIKLLNYLVFLLAIYYLWKKLEIYELEKVRLLSTYSLLAAVFLIFISFFLQSIAWSKLFEIDKPRFLIKAWLSSNIAKYIPLKVGVIIKRINEIKSHHPTLSGKLITKNYFIEQVIIIVTAVLISICYFVETLLNFSIIFLISVFLMEIVQGRSVKVKLFRPFSIYLLGQFFHLTALYTVSSAIFDSNSLEPASIYILSTIIGMFVFTAPSGIGVRESTFLFFLAESFDPTSAITFIVVVRILTTIIDILTYLLSMLFTKK